MLGTRPAPSEQDSTVWNADTGETWAEAMERFGTFGPAMDASAVLALPDDAEVMSFGYGDDPDYFCGVTVGELREAAADGDDIGAMWGPFAVWETN